MASIRKRGDKWQVQVRRQGSPAVSRSFFAKADALAWARQMEAREDCGDLPSGIRSLTTLRLKDLLDRYLAEVTSKKRSRTSETFAIRTLRSSSVAGLALANLVPGEIARYRDRRLQEVKPRTVGWELSNLRHVLETARREWDVSLPGNPVDGVRKPKPDAARNRRVARGEYEALLSAAAQCRNPLILPLFQLAIDTGMRRGELLNMRWKDLDLECRVLTIPATKNGTLGRSH